MAHHSPIEDEELLQLETDTDAREARVRSMGLTGKLTIAMLFLVGALAGVGLLAMRSSERPVTSSLHLDSNERHVVDSLISRQLSLARAGQVTTFPDESDFEGLDPARRAEVGRILTSADSSLAKKGVYTKPRVGYAHNFPEHGEHCKHGGMSCGAGFHCCDSVQIPNAAKAQLYSVCCANHGAGSQCAAKLFFVACEQPR